MVGEDCGRGLEISVSNGRDRACKQNGGTLSSSVVPITVPSDRALLEGVFREGESKVWTPCSTC